MSKTRRKQLRKLHELAEARELEKALSAVEQFFSRWRAGEIDCFELSQKIHEFHDGISRDIWKRYARFKPDQVVPWAIAEGTLEEAEVDPALLEELQDRIRAHRQDLKGD